jgi:hypothetical protein
MAKAIQKIIPAIDKDAQLGVWLPWAKDKETWESLVKKWWKDLHQEEMTPENLESAYELPPEDLTNQVWILNQNSPPLSMIPSTILLLPPLSM